jgi:DNA processing protein
LLAELGVLSEKNKFPLEKSERLVYSCLDLHPKSIDEISQKTALDIVTTAEILFAMERKGLVREAWQNHYISAN